MRLSRDSLSVPLSRVSTGEFRQGDTSNVNTPASAGAAGERSALVVDDAAGEALEELAAKLAARNRRKDGNRGETGGVQLNRAARVGRIPDSGLLCGKCRVVEYLLTLD